MRRAYRYVGPERIREGASGKLPGAPVGSAADVLEWIARTGQERDRSGDVTATFVVDEDGRLRLADRRSEHVACAGGGRVLAAGEITFSPESGGVIVEGVTNQSTGYCPEPESWPAVAASLEDAGLRPPAGFAVELTFRRCLRCDSINIVKDQVFVCAVCAADLPSDWNFGPESPA